MAYSVALFALPAALYHLALARVRHDAVLLGIVIAAVAVVYLPTSFFIIGEYNATFAAVTAGMAVALTTAREPPGRCGPSLRARPASACAPTRRWSISVRCWPPPSSGRRARDRDLATRVLAGIAALAFVGRRRGLGRDHRRVLEPSAFHQGAVDELRLLAEPAVRHPDGRASRSARRPGWPGRPGCRGAGRSSSWASPPPCSRPTPWWRLLHEHSILYPPAHYLARQAAGVLLAVLLGCMWLHVAWQRKPPLVLATLRLPAVVATPGRGHDGACHRRRRSRHGADGPVVGLSRPHAQPGRRPAGHRSRRARCRCSIGRTSCSPRTGRCPP